MVARSQLLLVCALLVSSCSLSSSASNRCLLKGYGDPPKTGYGGDSYGGSRAGYSRYSKDGGAKYDDGKEDDSSIPSHKKVGDDCTWQGKTYSHGEWAECEKYKCPYTTWCQCHDGKWTNCKNDNSWDESGEEGEHEPAAFNLLIFGDSLSDTGNLFALTQDTPDPEVYFQGRFSNGYIWPDYLDASTKGSVRSWAVTNYAFISATACPFCASQEHVLPITEQVSNYLQGIPPPATSDASTQPPFDAVFILAGANDYLTPVRSAPFSSGDYETTGLQALLDSIIPAPASVVSCIMDSVFSLIPTFKDQTTLFIAGLPSLEQGPAYSLLPAEIAQPLKAALAVASQEHNNLLKAEIERFQALVRPRTPVQLKYFDLDGLLDSITQADNLKELGIFITDRSCVQLEPFALDELEVESVCKQPAQYVFYDPFHYTSTIHREVAKGIAKALDGKGTDKSCKE